MKLFNRKEMRRNVIAVWLMSGILLSALTVAVNPLLLIHASAVSACENLPVVKATAIGYAGHNKPSYAIDNDWNTRWTRNAEGSWIKLDLGTQKVTCNVGIAWYKGDQLRYDFVIAASADGTTYKNVFTGTSVKDKSQQTYSFNEIVARYIRVTVNGNTENHSTGITEMDVRGYTPLADTTAPSVEITSPADGGTYTIPTESSPQITIEGTASDNINGGKGVKVVEVRINDGPYVQAVPSVTGDWSKWEAILSIDSTLSGEQRIVPRATDYAGNQAWNSIYVTFVASEDKLFMASMVSYVTEQDITYSTMNSNYDIAKWHAALGATITSTQHALVEEVPQKYKVAEFFSYYDMVKNIDALKANGYDYISYDIEPGTGMTPLNEQNNWKTYVQKAGKLAHDNGMKLMVAPSQRADLAYGLRNGDNIEWYAAHTDAIHCQFQMYQNIPSTWLSYTKTYPDRARAVNPDILMTVQLTTTNYDPSLSQFQARWTEAKPYFDGITLWTANNAESKDLVRDFLAWFNESGR